MCPNARRRAASRDRRLDRINNFHRRINDPLPHDGTWYFRVGEVRLLSSLLWLWFGIGIGSILGFLVFWTAQEEPPPRLGWRHDLGGGSRRENRSGARRLFP